jgi:hypothetical protein
LSPTTQKSGQSLRLETIGLLSILVGLLAFAPGCTSEPVRQEPATEPGAAQDAAPQKPAVTESKVQELMDEQVELDESVYRFETQAQEHEATFVNLWDRLRRDDPWQVLEKFHFDELEFPSFPGWQPFDHGMPGLREAKLDGDTRKLTHEDYLAEIRKFSGQGWKVAQTEWHHSTYRPARNDQPATSEVSFEIHLEHPASQRRIQVKGELGVTWTDFQTWDKTPYPGTIEVRKTQVLEQTGDPLFKEILEVNPLKMEPQVYPKVGPVLVYDLDRDGLPEVVLAGSNLLYKNKGGGNFEKAEFLKETKLPHMDAAILGDFNGDGHIDFITAREDEKVLRFWPGGENGDFSQPSGIAFPTPLEHPHVITAGDIDKDGDLDLFLGQWRQPYEKGSMPTPYYDALDGHPDYLLLNDGTGKFTDATEGTPMAPKRTHRTFSASFADLDSDGNLDLLTVADFSGLDVFRNMGGGKFEDVTSSWVGERHAFGMSHVLDDFDGDGQQDFYMVGMSSTTARRLERLGIKREGFEKHDAMRMAMTFGNRLYLRRDGKFEEPPFRNDLARTGWSWGCASADFDNDGDRDLYVANGHLSGTSARDYCTRYWCHDVYTGDSKPSPLLHAFYSTVLGQGGWNIGGNVSWNGFEHNHLYLNQNGKGFRNTAFLAGMAHEYDARAVIATDLDLDGNPDLLVGRYDTSTYAFRLHIYRNQGDFGRNWVGVRLEDAPGRTTPGAVVTAKAGGKTWTRQVVTGDSFTAQHPAQVHFGLGKASALDSLEVRWQNGDSKTIQSPALGQYHMVVP